MPLPRLTPIASLEVAYGQLIQEEEFRPGSRGGRLDKPVKTENELLLNHGSLWVALEDGGEGQSFRWVELHVLDLGIHLAWREKWFGGRTHTDLRAAADRSGDMQEKD